MMAAFLEKKEFYALMDEVIDRVLLPGNSAATPKKKVRVMMCAAFEDASNVEESFFHYTPVHLDDLPPFRLCHPKYWAPELQNVSLFGAGKALPSEHDNALAIAAVKSELLSL